MLAGTPVLVHNDDGTQPPPIVQRGIQAYQNGQLSPRMVDGQVDIYQGFDAPKGVGPYWKGSTIYEIPGGGNDYRLLVKPDGPIGWVGPTGGRPGAGHNYQRITQFNPSC